MEGSRRLQATRRVKSLADILWTVVRWVLPLTVAAVIVAVALGSHRLGEELRRRVEARLQERFPALIVRVRGAGFVEGEGILVRGISFANQEDPGRELVTIEEVYLVCGTTLAELAAG